MHYGALGAKDERASVEVSHARGEYQMQPAEAGSSVIQGDDTPDVSQHVYRRADIMQRSRWVRIAASTTCASVIASALLGCLLLVLPGKGGDELAVSLKELLEYFKCKKENCTCIVHTYIVDFFHADVNAVLGKRRGRP